MMMMLLLLMLSVSQAMAHEQGLIIIIIIVSMTHIRLLLFQRCVHRRPSTLQHYDFITTNIPYAM